MLWLYEQTRKREKKWNDANKEFRRKVNKKWRDKNKNFRSIQAKSYYQDKKETLLQHSKEYYSNNKEVVLKQSKKWKIENSNAVYESGRAYSLRKKYNITVEDYDKIFNEQKGCCKICNKSQEELDRALAVDHCHTTGRIRGLLCRLCNVSLGGFKDNKELLIKAITYLEQNSFIVA